MNILTIFKRSTGKFHRGKTITKTITVDISVDEVYKSTFTIYKNNSTHLTLVSKSNQKSDIYVPYHRFLKWFYGRPQSEYYVSRDDTQEITIPRKSIDYYIFKIESDLEEFVKGE